MGHGQSLFALEARTVSLAEVCSAHFLLLGRAMALEPLLLPGASVVDVGANLGLFALPAARS